MFYNRCDRIYETNVDENKTSQNKAYCYEKVITVPVGPVNMLQTSLCYVSFLSSSKYH
jgi:hypothetical protein